MRRPRWSIPVALGVVLVAIIGAWLVGADLPLVGLRGPVDGLTGIEWRVAAFEERGERWEVPGDVDTQVRFDARSFDAHVCNFTSGGIVIHSSTMAVGSVLSTAMECGGDEGRTEDLFSRALGGTWSSVDGVLRLGDEGVTAELVPRAPFPTKLGTRFTGSDADDATQWQFGSTPGDDRRSRLVWEWRTGPGEPWAKWAFPMGGADERVADDVAAEAHLVGDGNPPFVITVTDVEEGEPRIAVYEARDGTTTPLRRTGSGVRTIFFGPVAATGGTVVVREQDGSEYVRLGPVAL